MDHPHPISTSLNSINNSSFIITIIMLRSLRHARLAAKVCVAAYFIQPQPRDRGEGLASRGNSPAVGPDTECDLMACGIEHMSTDGLRLDLTEIRLR